MARDETETHIVSWRWSTRGRIHRCSAQAALTTLLVLAGNMVGNGNNEAVRKVLVVQVLGASTALHPSFYASYRQGYVERMLRGAMWSE